MYHKIKNTLVSLGVAAAMLGMSYSVGHPPVQSAKVDFSAPGIEASVDSLPGLLKRNRGMRSQLMPFFSFAPLLPRRES